MVLVGLCGVSESMTCAMPKVGACAGLRGGLEAELPGTKNFS